MLAQRKQRSRTVQRRLSHAVDPLALYAAVSKQVDESALFEAPGGPTVLMAKAAVRAECRGSFVTLRALSGNGRSLLRMVAIALATNLVGQSDDALELRIDPARQLDAKARLEAPSALDAVRGLLASGMPDGDPFAALAIGIVSFDFALLGEDLPANAEDPLNFPDYLFWIPESVVLFESGQARVICAAFADDSPEQCETHYHDAVQRLADLTELSTRLAQISATSSRSADADVDLDDEAFMAVVARLKEEICAGEIFQVVPSRTFSAACPDPLAAYAALRGLEPDSFRFLFNGPEFTVLGASPEISVRVTGKSNARTVEVRPIAGTRPRGATQDADDRMEAELRLDGKELAEHMMLVDLARNDVGRISEPGTRHVAKLMTVERYARVMHLVSSVTGRLADGLDALHALAACLNVGTLTGAPKIRASELLRQHEQTRRGPYGGAIGWVNGAGAMDTAVVIRSAIVRNGIAHVRAGAGVVFDSDPRAEADETRRKASAVLSILGAICEQ